MAVEGDVYLQGLAALAREEVAWETDTIKCALLSAAYTPDMAAHDGWDDVSAHEIAAGGGYTAGGETLASRSIVVDGPNNRTNWEADNVAWLSATLSADYAVVYNDTPAADADKVLIGLVTFNTTLSATSETFTVQWTDGVVVRYQAIV